jgi:hypothetical protein
MRVEERRRRRREGTLNYQRRELRERERKQGLAGISQ